MKLFLTAIMLPVMVLGGLYHLISTAFVTGRVLVAELFSHL